VLVCTQAGDVMERLRESGALDAFPPERLYPDVDRAMEAAEDHLLNEDLPGRGSGEELPLGNLGLLARLEADERATLSRYLTRVEIDGGREIFREGERGFEMMLMAKGAASAWLQSPGGSIRLATFEKGKR